MISSDCGFDTIGNATIIAYDKNPVLVTDPWIQGSAYFGSWRLSHAIPEAQRQAILQSPTVWFSHGHPDHINAESLPLFKGKKILIPDHVGRRIYNDLKKEGFDVHILKCREWVQISERVKVMCIADLGQDAILLLDINGRLVANTNDCGENGWGWFVKRLIAKYPISFLTCLSGYGDADMNNFFDEQGKFLPPEAAKKAPIGAAVAEACEKWGVKYFIPSSSMHRYQRSDSLWADAYTAGLSEYANGFVSNSCTLLPAFLRYDCVNDKYEKINPPENPHTVFEPEKFGDNWSDELEKTDLATAAAYFKAVESLADHIGFINLKVGGRDNFIDINRAQHSRGITFSAPRHSLMTAIEYEVFDDMLIGNFMKTTLHGDWPAVSLHPYFTGFVCKFADNGRAKTKTEVAAYIRTYEKRSRRLWYKRREDLAKDFFKTHIGKDNAPFRFAKWAYQGFKRLAH